MKRYHFSINGEFGHVGLAGAIFADNDGEALGFLQEVLDDSDDAEAIGTDLVSEDGDFAGISYANFYTNGAIAKMEMFDEIEEVEPHLTESH